MRKWTFFNQKDDFILRQCIRKSIVIIIACPLSNLSISFEYFNVDCDVNSLKLLMFLYNTVFQQQFCINALDANT
jgi:hypothetical protein